MAKEDDNPQGKEPKTRRRRVFRGALLVLLVTLAIAGAFGLHRYNSRPHRQGRRPWLLRFLFPPRSRAIQLVCGTNLKNLHSAMMVYAHHADGYYPDRWCDSLVGLCTVPPKCFICSKSDAVPGESSYAFNKYLAGAKPSEVPADVVVLFETDFGKDRAGRNELFKNRYCCKTLRYLDPRSSNNPQLKNALGSQKVYKNRWNQVGGPELLSIKLHDGKGCNIIFNDGTCKFVRTADLPNLKWKPEQAQPAGTSDPNARVR